MIAIFHRRLGGAFACLALAAAACSSESPVVIEEVSGTFVYSYWQDDGTKVDVVPAGAAVRALVPDASGAYQEYPGTVAANGSFVVPGVPQGTFFLEARSSLSVPAFGEHTARSGLDLGRDIVGRKDVMAAGPNTILNVNVTGVDPWQGTDSMALLSSGANLSLATGGAVLNPGDTSGQVQYGLNGRNLPRTADTVHVYQLRDAGAVGAGTVRVATRAGSFTSVDVADMVPTDVNVPLSTAPQTGSVAVDWKTSQFETYKLQMAPSGSTYSHELAVEVVPHSTAPMPVLPAAAALLQLSAHDVTPDQALGSLPYGQSLPSYWKEVRRARYTAVYSLSAAGGSINADFRASIQVRDPQPASGAIVPRVSPPRSPRLNGVDAMQNQPTSGLTPTFAWSAPALGTPTDYVLDLLSVKASGGSTVVTSVYTMRVLGTQVTVPSGVIKGGTIHVALLTARVRPSVPVTSPGRQALPDASAAAVLAAFGAF